MPTLSCNVVSAQEAIYTGDVKMLMATGIEGELGILPGHIPLVTLLKPGPVRVVEKDGTQEVVYVSGGVLEVLPEKITLLADSAVRASDLDEAKIEQARKEAEALLSEQKSSLDTSAALASLAESVAQMQTLRKFKNKVM